MYDLTTLNPQQHEAVLHDRGPLLILAGAGSGKTRVITHRVAYLIEERQVSPYSILAITFTNKAAREMKERVVSLLGDTGNSIWISTFHSTCVRILRKYIETIGFNRDFSIYDTDDTKTLMKQVCKDLAIDTKKVKERVFINGISSLKNECISPLQFASKASSLPEKQLAKVYTEYQKRLRENNALDFDDLLCKTVELFEQNADALEYYRRKFEYIMVDEYQDTNNAQFRLIQLLASHTNEYGDVEHNLCVVGDDDQSIYKFRGADITNILSFENVFHNAKVIKLEQNYRSTGNILSVANEVISNNKGRKTKKLWTAAPSGDNVCFIQYNSDFDEARGIVNDIIQCMSDDSSLTYSNFAILYRTNAQSRLIEECLVYRNIPYRIVGGLGFYQRKEIKDILAYLKTTANGFDTLQTKRIINIPKRGIGDTTVSHIQDYADETGMSFFDALCHAPLIPSVSRALPKITSFTDLIYDFRAKLSELSVSELIKYVVDETDYYNYIEEYDPENYSDREENINSLIDKAISFEEEHGSDSSLSEFLTDIALVSDLDNVTDNENCVLLMTMHSAKGLEFDNVYISGMEDGLFPSSLSMEDAELEEERRLCYVGITRARKHLTLTAAKYRMTHGETTCNQISRFVIKEIPRHMLSMKGHARESFMRAEKSAADTNRCVSRDSFLNEPAPVRTRSSSSRVTPVFTDNYKIREIKPPTGVTPGYDVGDRVKHIRFGEGTVTNIARGTKDFEVTVDFNGVQKKMLASFAKLKKIN